MLLLLFRYHYHCRLLLHVFLRFCSDFECYFGMQLAAQWLVISSGNVSLFLQREIGLASFMAAIQTYCLKVSQASCWFSCY